MYVAHAVTSHRTAVGSLLAIHELPAAKVVYICMCIIYI